MVFSEEENFAKESKDKVLSLSKFKIKIIKVRHLLSFNIYSFAKINTTLLLNLYQFFIFLLGHLHFILHFFLHVYGEPF